MTREVLEAPQRKEVRVITRNNVSVGIPAEYLPEDALYCFTIMAYLSNEIICEDLFFKMDKAKVAKAISNDSRQANSAPTSVDAFTDVAAGSPKSTKTASFSDVLSSADYAQAVSWAMQVGITKWWTA